MAVETERRGPVLVVTIDRPEVRNAVDRPTADELEAVFRRFDEDEASAVAVLRGADGTFCAGADLHAIGTDPQRSNRVERSDHAPMGPTRLTLSKPVIAAVEGYAVAGGLELACWAELRVAAQDAVFGVFCRRWGVPLLDGGTVRLPRLIGQSRALDMILTGRPVDGSEAYAIGLANRLVAPGETLEAAVALATDLADFPQDCMRTDLASARHAHDTSLEEGLLAEHDRGERLLAGDEIAEGLHRFRDGAGRHGTFEDA